MRICAKSFRKHAFKNIRVKFDRPYPAWYTWAKIGNKNKHFFARWFHAGSRIRHLFRLWFIFPYAICPDSRDAVLYDIVRVLLYRLRLSYYTRLCGRISAFLYLWWQAFHSHGDKTIVATEGQVCFLNCHLTHEYYTIGHTEFVWIHINGSNIQQLYDHVLDLYGAHVFYSTVAPQIKKDIFDFVYVCRNDQMMPDLEASHRIYRMILTLLSGIPQRKSILTSSKKSHRITDSVVSSAMQFIGNNYRHSISVTDIAQNVSMSKAHFSRIFKKQSGYAPHEYLIQIRLNRAKHLLKTTEMPIKNISQEVGYQDVTTFTSAFTNRVGLSPAQFRNSSLGST